MHFVQQFQKVICLLFSFTSSDVWVDAEVSQPLPMELPCFNAPMKPSPSKSIQTPFQYISQTATKLSHWHKAVSNCVRNLMDSILYSIWINPQDENIRPLAISTFLVCISKLIFELHVGSSKSTNWKDPRRFYPTSLKSFGVWYWKDVRSQHQVFSHFFKSPGGLILAVPTIVKIIVPTIV